MYITMSNCEVSYQLSLMPGEHIYSPPFSQRIRSKMFLGCLKLWLVLDPTCTIFSYTYMSMVRFNL